MKKIICLTLAAFAVTSCANNDSIARKTAHILGVDSVTISDLQRGMAESSFKATDNRGVKYNCTYYGGNAMTFGQVMSPSCTKVGGSNAKSKRIGACNAMLRAAGRC